MANKKTRAAEPVYEQGIFRWDYPTENIFANNGETETIPVSDPTLRRINYSDGFSHVYSTKPSEGGAYVPRLGFNALFNFIYKALQELQAKTAQITKGVTPQGFDYLQEWLPDGNILIKVWGAMDLPAGSGSQAGGNDIVINLPYRVIPEHSGYSVMLRPPAGSTGTPYAYVVEQSATMVKFHTTLYSASSPIHIHVDLKFLGDILAYPPAPVNIAANVAETTATVTWRSGAL